MAAFRHRDRAVKCLEMLKLLGRHPSEIATAVGCNRSTVSRAAAGTWPVSDALATKFERYLLESLAKCLAMFAEQLSSPTRLKLLAPLLQQLPLHPLRMCAQNDAVIDRSDIVKSLIAAFGTTSTPVCLPPRIDGVLVRVGDQWRRQGLFLVATAPAPDVESRRHIAHELRHLANIFDPPEGNQPPTRAAW